MSDVPNDPRARTDALLREWLASGADPSTWRVPDELAGDRELATELAELADVVRRLDALADDPRAVLAAARDAERPTDRADVAAALERARAQREPPMSHRAAHRTTYGATSHEGRRRRVLIATAIAAGLLGLLFVARPAFRSAPDAGDQPLGGSRLELLAPLGTVDSFTSFRWRFELPPGGHFEVRVYDRVPPNDANARPTIRSPRLTASEWTPPPNTVWPRALRWEVVAHDASGSVVAAAAAVASRSD